MYHINSITDCLYITDTVVGQHTCMHGSPTFHISLRLKPFLNNRICLFNCINPEDTSLVEIKSKSRV